MAELLHWLSVGITVLCAVICFIFTATLIYHFTVNTSTTTIKRCTKALTISCMLLLTLSCILQVIVVLYLEYTISTLLHGFLMGLAISAWWIGQALCYIMYINRLSIFFFNTKYQLHNNILYPLYILLTLFLLCHISAFIIWLLEYFRFGASHPLLDFHSAGIFYAFLFMLAELVDLSICVLVLYIFASRLTSLLAEFNEADQAKNVHPFRKMTQRKSYVDLNLIQKTMVQIMTQWTVLTTLSVIATQIFLIVRVVTEICYAVYFDENGHAWLASLILQTIQSAVTVVATFLMFEFGKDLYVACCTKLDRYCFLWFKNAAKRKVTAAYESTQNVYMRLDENDCYEI